MTTQQHQQRKIIRNEDLISTKLFNVKGFKAVVTGGGTGIGLMITQALVANGADVYITGRRQEALDTVVKEYTQRPSGGGKIIGLSCDITKKDDLARLAAEVAKREPEGIHLLVNNAGVAEEKHETNLREHKPNFNSAQSIAEFLWKASPESWADTFETNVTAQFFTTAAFLPLLGKAGAKNPGFSSSVINIASISGVLKTSSNGQYAYAASKAGFIHLTRLLANLLTDAKIRVNCIAPGLFPSEMTTGDSDEKNKSTIGKDQINCPAGRPGKEEDMGASVLYLAGVGGLYVNGMVLYLDGGITLTSAAAV